MTRPHHDSTSSSARAWVARLVPALALGCLVLVLAPGFAARGQLADRTAIIRVLRESRDFRARIRAAMALGASADPSMAAPLATALTDENPAVRAAAAEGLARIGGPTQLGALHALSRDGTPQVRDAATRAIRAIESRVEVHESLRSSAPTPAGPGAVVGARPPPASTQPPTSVTIPPIRWADTRYVVVLGSMENRSGYPHDPLAAVLRSEVTRALGEVRGVGILAGAPTSEEAREIDRRRIRRFRLDGSIRTMRPEAGRDLRVRCEVSLMLLDDPGLNLRAALNGAATGSEPLRSGAARTTQERLLAERALQGAVRSAMNGASRALAGAQR